MALISLLELADLSIGTPEIGVVNFNALHTLLHAIIKQLNLQDVKAEMHEEKPKPPEPVPLQEKEEKGKRDESEDLPYADLEKKVIGVAAQVHGVEAKVVGMAAQVHGVEAQVHGVKSQVHGIGEQVQGLEKQMAALEKLPSGTDLLERTKSGSPNGSAVADMWQMMQMKKKIEANENGISKAMALFQDLLNEVNGVKTANFHMNEDLENIKEKLDLNLQLDTQEIGNRLQTCIADQKNLDNDVRNLERRLNLYPSPEEMYNMVRWEVLEDCLVTGKGKSPPTEAQSVEPSLSQPSPASVMDTQARKPSATWAGAPGSQSGSPSSRPGTPGVQAGTRAGMPAVQPAARTGTPGTRTGTPESQAITPAAQPGAQPGSPRAQPGAQPGSPRAQPGAQPGSPGAQPGVQPGAQAGSPRTQPGAQPGFPGAQPGAQAGFPGAQPGAQAGFPGAQAGSPGAQPGAEPGFPGVQPGSQGAQPGFPGAQPGAQAGFPGAQPGFPGAQPGAQPGFPGVQPGAQPGFPGAQPGAQAGFPGAQPGAQPGFPGAQPGAQPGFPGAQPGAQAGFPGAQPGAQAGFPGAQPGFPGAQPGAQPGFPGAQPGSQGVQPGAQPGFPGAQPGAQPGFPGAQPGFPRAQPGAQPGFPGAQPGFPGVQPGAQPGFPGAQSGAQPGFPVAQPGAQPGFPGAQPGFPGAQAGSAGAQAVAPGFQPSFPGTWPSSPATQVGLPGVWPGAPGTQAGYLGTPADTSAFQPTSPTAGAPALAAQLAIPPGPYSAVTSPASPLQEKDKRLPSSTPQESSGSSSASSRYSDTVEALRQIGQLTDLYTTLQEQINHLEQFKCSHADLDKLRQFLSDAVPKNLSSMPADLMEQLSSLKATAEDMKDVKAKVRKLQNVLEAEVATEADQKVKGSSQINLQLGYLRSTVHDIEKELQELREQQDHGKAKLEQSVTDTALYLQEQLDKLRSIIENMMASSSTLLSMSMPTSPEPGEAAPHGTCPACSLDVSEQVSQLFKRYEQLQDLISSFMTRHAESKPAKRPQLRSQDEELLSRIQNTILQVQGDCENLNATTGNLVEDHRQKQKDISLLFQSLEKLEKEKADKEHLETEIDVKADKIALAGKVSRTQFDATTEQLNKMVQDLVNKMSGQEQDWHKVLDKILVEMDSKLDRLELDPFRQQLEERWKAIRKQLKESSPQYEADDAAGIRKRLMAHFHCISCDRPLEMVVPGPTIMTVPSVPGLPSHRSIRPYTVYELEQVRQHTRSDKMAEMAEYGYLSMPRRCGGSHTLTYPYRRYTRLQQIAQCMPVHPEETAMLTVMKHEEVDILGLDGHIYKGRMDTRLPSISAKDGPLKSKPKLSRSSSQRQPTLMDTAGLPARPHSAKLSSPSNSGTARSLKDRPVSSEGRLSRVDLTHLSTSTPPPEEGREDSPTQEKETLELQLDLSMRRRSAEQPAPLQ
ncbi:glutamine-rich protein 2 isoform X2 [Chrysemys picta bellii]|uniref:glutamine-rich protein 2 isoform X2 n=1 Tax=Chrysemys picta bellii TaxID=8478 RepID=UPI0032B1C530